MRGFVLAGDPDFLEPYNAASDALPELFVALRAYAHDIAKLDAGADFIAMAANTLLMVAMVHLRLMQKHALPLRLVVPLMNWTTMKATK